MGDSLAFRLSAKESLKKTVCDYKTHIAEIAALHRDTTRCLKEIQDLIKASRRTEPLFSLPALQVPDFNFGNRLPCVLFIGTHNCGKTTLLNVFLGKHILPTHETPCTARLVRMVYSSGNENYVTLVDSQGHKQETRTFKDKVPRKYIVLKDDERQDGEKLKTIVEVGVKDIKLLECGIELIDSPGRNENEALDLVVEEFLSKGVVPLIVYVVDGNNQLQQTDRTTIRELQNKFPNVSLMFVCSKVDVEKKAKAYDKDEDNDDDEADDPFDEELFNQAQKKKYDVFHKLKNLDFLPSDDEIESSSLFHGVSARMVKLSRKRKLRNAATMSFENLELCIFEKLESSFRKESKKALSILLSTQEMILTSVVDKERTFANAVSSVSNAYNRAIGIELSLFSLILDLIVKGKTITNAIGSELEKLAEIFIKEGEKYQFKANGKRNAESLVEEFCSEIKGSILDRTFNVLKRSVKRDLKRSLVLSVLKVEELAKSVESALLSRFIRRAYASEYHQERKQMNAKRLVENCAVLDGILESFSIAIDVALRRELSRHLEKFDLKNDGANAPKPKDSSWRRKVVQGMLSKINCKELAKTVVKTCGEALKLKHQEFVQDVREFKLLNQALSSHGVESMVTRLRTDYVPQVAELAVKGHALQYVIERGGPPELGEEEMCTAHGRVHSCSSPLWCADRDCCMVKVVTKSAVGSKVWNQTMLDCMHTIDIVEKLGTCCPKFLQLNGWFLPEPDKLYIVMEKAVEDLLAALKRGMSWEKRLRVAIDVAEGVSAIHKANYIYQDLKPQNVMLTVDGTSKVNLCKPEKPFETTKLGIPFHISPTMFLNYQGGSHAKKMYDIYAFGSLLWVLCEGSGEARPQVYSHCYDIDAMKDAVCHQGIRPERPPKTPDAWWDLMTLCWKEDASTKMQNVLDQLLQIHYKNTCTMNG
ncbi:dual serine/threonine and tyrosine protein kinase-like [Actinia tenebrosa]|uniref:Dual serine/threonine and tyrosine protein kinase n=1 Tax=Actinia tenebrosa TaxID=6105 RepID=A0A6P8I7X2_ACTTE|nr:dual serine/threonine and tyrosine protein kinase-like [Actinia tenebrosa]